jgi:hypothetical protein
MACDLQIIPAAAVDKIKWDQCVSNANNGLIYSTYDYLDAMCDQWHGVICNDYETVMALPWRSKFGIRYLYEPAFIQQLGWVGEAIVPGNEIVEACFAFAPYGDMLFNFANRVALTDAQKRTNLVVELSTGYDHITSNYKKDLQQDLKKSAKANLSCVDGDIRSAVALYRASYQDRFRHITAKDYASFERLCQTLAKNDMAFVKKVIDAAGAILCTAVFLKDGKRIYNIMNTTTAAGRSVEANSFLLDQVLQEFSGQNLLFDFEGSDLPGVKSFYEKFGAIEQPFYHYHFNRLPFPFRLFKR